MDDEELRDAFDALIKEEMKGNYSEGTAKVTMNNAYGRSGWY